MSDRCAVCVCVCVCDDHFCIKGELGRTESLMFFSLGVGVCVCACVCACALRRNSTYCMKVSMSLTVEQSDEGLCFSSRIKHQAQAEVTKSKMISCPDLADYLAPYKQPQVTWYKVDTPPHGHTHNNMYTCI